MGEVPTAGPGTVPGGWAGSRHPRRRIWLLPLFMVLAGGPQHAHVCVLEGFFHPCVHCLRLSTHTDLSPYLSVSLGPHCSVFFPFKCTGCISFCAQMDFPLLYTEGKGNVRVADIAFMSCLKRGSTI